MFDIGICTSFLFRALTCMMHSWRVYLFYYDFEDLFDYVFHEISR